MYYVFSGDIGVAPRLLIPPPFASDVAVNLATLVRPTNRFAAQFMRYAMVGGIAFAVDFALLVFLTEQFGVRYMVSAAFAFVAGLATNYWLSVQWVFDHRRVKRRSVEFAIFALVGVFGLLLTELVLWSGTELLGVDYRLSKIASVAIVLMWNFGVRKALLFRS